MRVRLEGVRGIAEGEVPALNITKQLCASFLESRGCYASQCQRHLLAVLRVSYCRLDFSAVTNLRLKQNTRIMRVAANIKMSQQLLKMLPAPARVVTMANIIVFHR